MRIAIPLFDKVTALDAVGPYEVLQRLPVTEVVFVGERIGSVRTDNGMLGLSVDAAFSDLPDPDVIVVPGGIGTRPIITDPDHPIFARLAAAHPCTRYTTSVCTGSLVLAAAGLLNGLEATTHWGAMGTLEQLGAIPTGTRVVDHPDARIMTAAGVSSGIDMALLLAARLFDDETAKAMQLMIEYDPMPPFDAGSLDKAGPDVLARVQDLRGMGRG